MLVFTLFLSGAARKCRVFLSEMRVIHCKHLDFPRIFMRRPCVGRLLKNRKQLRSLKFSDKTINPDNVLCVVWHNERYTLAVRSCRWIRGISGYTSCATKWAHVSSEFICRCFSCLSLFSCHPLRASFECSRFTCASTCDTGNATNANVTDSMVDKRA